MYDPNMREAGRRRAAPAHYSFASGRSRRGKRSSGQESVRLIQLVICLVLFLVIYLGKGIFPQKLGQVREDVLALISTDLDFRGALSHLGGSLAGGDTVLADLGAFCVEVFGPGEGEEGPVEPSTADLSQPVELTASELGFLGRREGTAVRTAHYTDFSRYRLELAPLSEGPAPEEIASAELEADPEAPPAVPAAGTVIMVSDYSGQEPPENYTMDQLSLGDLETMPPVLGRLNSPYGYRDHPINGKYLFHGGVDIGGDQGDPIHAFAAGTVEYTGENDTFGLYLQVDHGNGVKSFYAHCSKIVVIKGQEVAMGEKLAEIGSTGLATGPHLHLELKYEKMHLDPAYYVEFLEE